MWVVKKIKIESICRKLLPTIHECVLFGEVEPSTGQPRETKKNRFLKKVLASFWKPDKFHLVS
jgi:hypothetical protein